MAFVGISYSQNTEDFGIWLGSDFSKKINKKVDAVGSISLRTEDNSTHVKQIFYQLGAKVEVFDNFKTAISYRNGIGFDYYENKWNHRFIWDLSYKLKGSFFAFQLRNRMQYSLKGEGESELLNRIRLKGKVELQKDLDAFIFNEIFLELNNAYKNHLESNRFGFGMSYKINKDLSVGLSYFRQATLGFRKPNIFNGISLEFEIDLKLFNSFL